MDIFSASMPIEQKAEWLKGNLDKIAEKSGDYLLLPVGADHLGIEKIFQNKSNRSINCLMITRLSFQVRLNTLSLLKTILHNINRTMSCGITVKHLFCRAHIRQGQRLSSIIQNVLTCLNKQINFSKNTVQGTTLLLNTHINYY